MKLIARILLILAAAGAVSGIAFALVGSSGAQGEAAQRGMPAQMQAGAAPAFPEQAGGAQQRGDRPGGGRAPSLFGAGEMLKDLVIIALIVAVVVPVTKLLGRLRSDSEKQANPEPPVIMP